MYGLYTDHKGGDTLLEFLEDDLVEQVKSQKPHSMSMLENDDIIITATVTIRYDDPDKSSTFLYKGYKLVKVVDTE